MSRPSYLSKMEPYEALCHHFNVFPPDTTESTTPATYTMRVTRDAHMPTHVLAAVPSDDKSAPPIMLPIDASLYQAGFRVDISIPPAPPGSTAPIPQTVGGSLVVVLPVIPIRVPDPSTLPLLLLYGLGLEKDINPLTWRLLPSQVIEEFPNAATMALILSRARQDQFDRIFEFNRGLWQNILSLGLNHIATVEVVQKAWNVSVEARKIRMRPSTTPRH